MANWRLAKSLAILVEQLNALRPMRARGWDGGIANQRHLDEWEERKKKNPSAQPSDHIPNPHGMVCAYDLTNDPPHEVHCAMIAAAIRKSRDARVKYLIFNAYILRSYAKLGIPAWSWAKYAGSDEHNHHLHISVTDAGADDERLWSLE